jgi:Pentapeptide repeats (9 copies)
MVDHPPQPADDNAKAQQRRLVRRLAVAGPLVLGLLVVLLLACVLWIPKWLYPPLTDNDLKDVKTAQNELDAAKVQELKDARLKLQNDARTTLLQGVGALLLLTGAGIGAAVTLRQVRVSQDGLHATREQMQHTLEATREQLNLTEQGQVTDRYTRAVEQLGHEKAPVRLGALYSLEHLAQDNPGYRQTVVDVLCAYLRMPYTLPAQPEWEAKHVEKMASPANGRDLAPHRAPGWDPTREELQVRTTAQRLLADHLRYPPQTSGREAQLLPPSTQQTFWLGISLDLTGATLVDFSFAQVSVIQVQFAGASFQGSAEFDGATFQRAAGFDEATFQGHASFGKATFQGDAWFDAATFRGDTGFDEAHVLHFDNRDRHRMWPDGWIVRPDSTDPSRGKLVRAEHTKEPGPAAPRPTTPGN